MKKLFILLLLVSISLALTVDIVTFYPKESFETPGGYTVTVYEPETEIISPGNVKISIDIAVTNPKGVRQRINKMQEEDFPYFHTNEVRVKLVSYCMECANGKPKAELEIFDYTAADKDTGFTFVSEITIKKGWNLVSSNFDNVNWAGSSCDSNDFKAIFFFDNVKKEYFPISKSGTYSKSYFKESATWIYSPVECKMKYHDLETGDTIDLIKGWNFLGLTNKIKNKIFGSGVTNCEFEKAHYLLSSSNSWSSNINLNHFSMPIALGYGFVVKVADDCHIDLRE